MWFVCSFIYPHRRGRARELIANEDPAALSCAPDLREGMEAGLVGGRRELPDRGLLLLGRRLAAQQLEAQDRGDDCEGRADRERRVVAVGEGGDLRRARGERVPGTRRRDRRKDREPERAARRGGRGDESRRETRARGLHVGHRDDDHRGGGRARAGDTAPRGTTTRTSRPPTTPPSRSRWRGSDGGGA